MLQYKVPQNVGIEDRIVGPLTLRQLILLAVGGGVSYLLFAIASKMYDLNIFEYIVIAIPAFVSILAALVKINDITFTKFVILFLEFSIKPKRRFWDHRAIAPWIEPELETKKPVTQEETSSKKETKSVDLETLSRMLDSGGAKGGETVAAKDMDDVRDDYLVQQAFFGKRSDANAENMYWRCKDTHEARLMAISKKPPEPAPAPQPAAPKAAPATPAPVATVAPAPAAPIVQATTLPPPPPPAPSATPPPPAAKKTSTETTAKASFKGPVPLRQKKQINNLQKNKPLSYTPPPTPKKSGPPPAKKPASALGEISFDELKKGEIEINLD